MRIRFSKPQRKQKYLENKTSSYSSVKIKFCFYPQLNYPLPRTAIEAEILYQALYVHVQRLNTSLTKCQTRYCMEPRPSVDDCQVMRFLGAYFAQQNALLPRTTDIRVGTEKKHRWNKTAAAKRLKRYGAAEPTGVASKQARCRYLCTFA